MSRRKLTRKEKQAKRRRQRDYMTIFINGKRKRVRREPTIDGLSVDEFVERNADPRWLHQHEMWELLHERELHEQQVSDQYLAPADDCSYRDEDDDWFAKYEELVDTCERGSISPSAPSDGDPWAACIGFSNTANTVQRTAKCNRDPG